MKMKIYLLSISLFLLIGMTNKAMACLCNYAPSGGVIEAYGTYSAGVLSNPLPFANQTGSTVYAGQTVYYLASDICIVGGCGVGQPLWTVSGGTIVVSEFAYASSYAIGIQWGSTGTGTITATSYTGYGVPALGIIINGCSQGNISGAYTSYNTGTNTLSGALAYPTAVNAGDIVYYRAFSKSFFGTLTFVVTNGTLLNTYTASDGYKVAKVQWGTTGTATIVANANEFCPTTQSITVTTPGLVFDGTDDRVTVGRVATYDLGATNFTIEGWIKASASQNSNAAIFSNRSTTSNGIWFGLDTDGTLKFMIGTTTINGSTTDLRDNTWHHVALTRTASRTFTMFVDGADDGGGRPPAAATLTTSHALWIGDDDGDVANNSFTGSMKGMRFWNVGKTDVELLDAWKTNLNKYSSNLIGFWDMNDNNTQIQSDQSTTANNGTLGSSSSSDSQDPLITPNSPAPFTINALKFEGNDQRVTIPHNAVYNMGTGNFTVEAWVRPVNDAQTKTIISRRTGASDGFALVLNGSEKPIFTLNTIVLTSTTGIDFNNGDWHHVAVTRSGTTLSMYIDFEAIASNTATLTGSETLTTSASCELWVGKDKLAGTNGFNGLIDEARIWNVARTGTDMSLERYAKIIPDLTQNANLKGWWRFNAPVDQLDKDLSSIGNNSTLGSSTTLVDLQDPLRIAYAAFSGARKGLFSSNSNVPNSYASSLVIESYPNPFTGNINLKVTGLFSENVGVTVLDITGAEVYRGTILEDEIITFGEKLPTGMYIVKITDDSAVKTMKIVKNK